MVKTVDYTLTLGGSEINHKYVKSITFKDEIDSKADEITVVTTAEFPRPAFSTPMTLSIGYKQDGLSYCGIFFVQSHTITNKTLTIRATAVDFTASTKERKNRQWENIDIQGIVGKIAMEHGWTPKCDKSHFYRYLAQAHESDLHFLQRLANDLNSTVTIKNKTLIFLDKNNPKPRYTCKVDDSISYSLELVNKTLYKSSQLTYRDDKQNKDVSVSVGSGTPQLKIRKSLDTFSKTSSPLEENAKLFAQDAMDKANVGTVRGRVEIVGNTAPKGGGEIELQGTKYDDGVYKIKLVTHRLSNSGWLTSIELEK